jgi:hypothetical protein
MIPKADRDADAAILAAATRGTWITAALPARAASPEIRLGSFGPCVDTPRNMLVMVCIQAPGATFGDVAMAEATTSWEQHAANAKAAAHAVNRLPEYIAELNAIEEAVTSYIEDVRGEVAEKRNPGAGEGHLAYQHGQIEALSVVLGMLRKKPSAKKRGGK